MGEKEKEVGQTNRQTERDTDRDERKRSQKIMAEMVIGKIAVDIMRKRVKKVNLFHFIERKS